MRLIFFLLGLLFSSTLIGQEGGDPLRFKHITLSDGLISKGVKQLYQDKKGFVWIGTTDGLQRYDGKDFKTFTHDPDNPNSLSDNMINWISEDRFGRLWITTRTGLTIYDPFKELFIRISSQTDSSFTDRSNDQHMMTFNQAGTLAWITTLDGLLEFDVSSLKYRLYKTPSDISNNQFSTIYLIDSLHCIVNHGEMGYAVFNTINKKFFTAKNAGSYEPMLSFFRQLSIGTALNKVAAGPLIKDKKNRIWFTAWLPGFYCYDPDKAAVTEINLNPALNNNEWKKMPFSFVENKTGHIWAATASGLYRIDPETRIIRNYAHIENNIHSLVSNKVNCVMEDRQGNIWAGTEEGVSICSPEKDYFSYPQLPQPEKFHELNGILRAKDSTIWMGTYTKEGLFHFDKNLQLLHQYNYFGKKKNFDENAIWHLTEARDGKILVSRQNGFSTIDPSANRIDNFNDIPVFKGRGISSSIEASDSTIWVSLYRGILVHLDPVKREYEVFRLGTGLRILAIKDDHLLLAVSQAAKYNLHSFNIHSRTLHREPHYFFKSSTAKTLQSISNTWGYLDYDGKKYVGTAYGLWILDETDDSFSKYARSNGLCNDQVFGLYRDHKGLIWIGTAQGLSVFNPETKLFRSFGESDGLNDLNFEQGNFIPFSNETILTANKYGPLFINLQNIQPLKQPPSPIITAIKIGNEEIPVPGDNKLSISHQKNNITIQFASLDFVQPQKIRYAYKLEGFDKDWVETGNKNTAIYTNLPGGKYVLRLKAANEDGVWNEEHTTMRFFVSTPFYKTGWFFALIAVVVIAILYAFYKVRIRRIIEMHNLRNSISRDLHDEVGSTLSSISMLSTSAKSLLERKSLEPAEDMVEKIKNSSQRILETMDDIIWTINPRKDSMQSLIGRMREVINELQDASGISFQFKTDPQAESLNLPMKTKKNFYLIFKEAITNCAKHAGCTEVQILLQKEPHQLLLSVNDNGKGFASGNGFTGNGLKNMQQRAEELKADLRIDSVPGKGTILSLNIGLS